MDLGNGFVKGFDTKIPYSSKQSLRTRTVQFYRLSIKQLSGQWIYVMILHLFCIFSTFVFCILLFVCYPAFWLLYINKVMLC